MYGPKLDHVNDSAAFFVDKVVEGGMVDFLVGAAPGNGAFVLGHSVDPIRKEYLKYLKMGEGPLYVFYTPFHLPQLEIPNTIARAALLHDATVAPVGGPMCESIAIAKCDLRAGDTLDGMGGFASYALLESYESARQENLLPMGVSEGCCLVRDVSKDTPLRYVDVTIPAGRLVDKLRNEQEARFPVVAARRTTVA
jgi:predicted homoserine dehydrogenase-like protein